MVLAFPVASPFAAALSPLLAPLFVFLLFVVLDTGAMDRDLVLEFFDLFAPHHAFRLLVPAAHADLTDGFLSAPQTKLPEKASF